AGPTHARSSQQTWVLHAGQAQNRRLPLRMQRLAVVHRVVGIDPGAIVVCGVVAVAAVNPVEAGRVGGEDPVVAGLAVDDVAAGAAVERVVSSAAIDPILVV